VATTAPVIDYRGRFRFAVAPEAVWGTIERTGEFEQWWGWLSNFHLDGPGLEAGSVLAGVVRPPLPYHMRVRVELEDCVRPSLIDAAVHGDLEGRARLELTADHAGTVASVAWTAARFALPLLRWGHDRVVEATARGFGRQLAASRDGRPPGHPPAR
jgi:carbon monoxide dehydrogenase subunit G